MNAWEEYVNAVLYSETYSMIPTQRNSLENYGLISVWCKTLFLQNVMRTILENQGQGTPYFDTIDYSYQHLLGFLFNRSTTKLQSSTHL